MRPSVLLLRVHSTVSHHLVLHCQGERMRMEIVYLFVYQKFAVPILDEAFFLPNLLLVPI